METSDHFKKLIGAKITKIRPMTEEEIETIYGDDFITGTPVIIETNNGIHISAQSDEENNAPGVLTFFDSLTGADAQDWQLTEEEK